MALVLLTLSMVLGVTTAKRARACRWPGFALQELHRRSSMLAIVFVALHVLTSVLDSFVHIGWLAIVIPFTSSYSPFWVGVGTVALDLMLAVFISSLLRACMKPGTWRGLHWLAYGCWPIALAHTFGMGTDAGEHWVIGLGAICAVSVGLALVWRVRTATKHHEALAGVNAAGVPMKRVAPTVLSGDHRHAR